MDPENIIDFVADIQQRDKKKDHDVESDDEMSRRRTARNRFGKFMIHRSGSALNKLALDTLRTQGLKDSRFLTKVIQDRERRVFQERERRRNFETISHRVPDCKPNYAVQSNQV